jgi:hypothetical protein
LGAVVAVSKTANWVYTNTATVRPWIGENGVTGEIDYGPDYEIACTWTAEAKLTTANNGEEFMSTNVIYTEDGRPRCQDKILINDPVAGWQEIRALTSWDMSFFGESNDYKLVT